MGDTLKMEYGKKLNPGHFLRITRGIKGTRQKEIIMHNSSEIDQNQLLLVRFPNLGSNDVIIQTPHLHKISNLTKKIVSTGQFTFDYKVLKRYMIGKIVKQRINNLIFKNVNYVF